MTRMSVRKFNIVYLVTLYQILLSQQIQIYFDTPKYGTFIPEIPLCLGTPNQCFLYSLDITSLYTIVPSIDALGRFKSEYQSTESTSFHGTYDYITIKYKGRDLSLTRAYDIINFPGTQTETIHPVITFGFITNVKGSEEVFNIDGVLGLLRNYDKKPGSKLLDWFIMNSLIKAELFTENIFGITYESSTKGILYMGEKPKNFNQEGSYGVCNSNETIKEWNCPINIVNLNNKQIILNKPENQMQTHIIFNTSTHWLKAPEEQGKQLFKHYIKISEQRCQMETSFDEIYLICSTNQDLSALPDLHFILDETQSKSLILKSKEMFRLVTVAEGERYKSNWIASSNYQHWQLGMIVMKNHDLFFSSSDNDQVFFKNNFRISRYSIWSYGKLVLMILSCIPVCILLFFVIRKYFFIDKKDIPMSTKVESLLQAELAEKVNKEDKRGIKL